MIFIMLMLSILDGNTH